MTNTNGSTPEASSNGNSTLASMGATPTKATIKNANGPLSLDLFNQAIGEEVKDLPEPLEEGDIGYEEQEREKGASGDDSASEEGAGENEEVLADGEEGAEEDSEESEALDATDLPKTKNAIKAKTKDGKEVALPEDLVIPWKVDGETQDIPLKEYMNIVAGELTVNQRLGKLASFKDELDREREEISSARAEDQATYTELLGHIEKGQPQNALFYLAEKSGKSPVELYRALLSHLNAAYKKFEGWSPEKIDNHFLQLELRYQKGRDKKKADQESKKKTANEFLAHCEEQRKHEGLTEEEFTRAVSEVSTHEGFKGWSREERLDRTLNHALGTKHRGMVDAAVKSIDPKLLKNETLIAQVLKVTDPHEWTVEEIAGSIREFLKGETSRIAANLSKKVGSTKSVVAATSEKKSEAKQKQKVRSQSDMQSAFGLL